MDLRATVETLTELGGWVHCLALGGVDLTGAAGPMISSGSRNSLLTIMDEIPPTWPSSGSEEILLSYLRRI